MWHAGFARTSSLGGVSDGGGSDCCDDGCTQRRMIENGERDGDKVRWVGGGMERKTRDVRICVGE